MGHKKRILDLRNRLSSDDSDSNDSSDVDSDEELQKAFAKGDLKPGLNAIVGFKKVEKHVNDRIGLKEKLDQLRLDLDWIERLDSVNNPAEVTPEVRQMFGNIDLKLNKKGEICAEDADSEDKTDNDFKREMLFYRRAQSAVLESIPRLKALKVMTKRPEDYFAEMGKTDDHMKKVRQNIVQRQTAIEKSEKAKKLREQKKYGKKIQTEVLLKRQKEKRELLNKLKKYKSGKEDNLNFLDSGEKGADNKTPENNKRKAMKPNKKQNFKNAKFGYGGQKKRSKYNTSKSSADMNKFRSNRHSKPTSKGKSRPGKSKRQNIKNRRKT